MSYRLKITLPIALAEQLNELAASTGEPAARLAAQMVRNGLAETRTSGHTSHSTATVALDTPEDQDAFRASWLEPYGGDREWSMWMWGGIVALHGRYPDVLAWLKEGWWKSQTHVEMLCALVVWREQIDNTGRDPRDEIAFQHNLANYGQILRQEGGGINEAWTPSVAPNEWMQ
jgi:hypothetical protein